MSVIVEQVLHPAYPPPRCLTCRTFSTSSVPGIYRVHKVSETERVDAVPVSMRELGRQIHTGTYLLECGVPRAD